MFDWLFSSLLDLLEWLSKVTWLGVLLDLSEDVTILVLKSLRLLLIFNIAISSFKDLSLLLNSLIVNLIWLISFCKPCRVTSLC